MSTAVACMVLLGISLSSCAPADVVTPRRSGEAPLGVPPQLACSTRGQLPARCASPPDLGRRSTDPLRRYTTLPSSYEDRSPGKLVELSDEARAAEKMFDEGRWSQAVEPLERVAGARAGVRLKTRRRFGLLLAVALFRSLDFAAAVDLFSAIVRNADHPEREKSRGWLVRLAFFNCGTPTLLSAVVEAPRLRITDGQHLEDQDSVVAARGLFELGRNDEALVAFEELDTHEQYGRMARACIAAIKRDKHPATSEKRQK